MEELLLPLFSDEWEETGEAARVLDGIVRILESKVGCCEGAKTPFSSPFIHDLPRVQLKKNRVNDLLLKGLLPLSF